MGRDREDRFRGGKKNARDRLTGMVASREFWRWYHRMEKGRTGAKDISAPDDVRTIYEEWVRLGCPKAP